MAIDNAHLQDVLTKIVSASWHDGMHASWSNVFVRPEGARQKIRQMLPELHSISNAEFDALLSNCGFSITRNEQDNAYCIKIVE